MNQWQKFEKNIAAERTYISLKDIAFKTRELKQEPTE